MNGSGGHASRAGSTALHAAAPAAMIESARADPLTPQSHHLEDT